MNYYENKYKECSPEETVEKIIGIFKKNGIDIEEEWAGENELGTYSLRINVKGCKAVGSNGKGTTREYARASAYAEFMERIQNMMLSSSQTLPTLDFNINADFIFCKDEKFLTAEEIIDDNNSFIQMYMENRGLENASRQDKINAFLKLERMDYYMFHKYNQFLCIPFYSVKEKKYVYLPYYSYRVYYGSNGMSAGNSPEEALVQALSEVFERVVNRKTIYESVSFPDIPDSFIKQNYPQIYSHIETLRKADRIRVLVKDCSCAGRYPVVGVYFVDKNTGYYGVKFGSHPNIGIALERCFTEATQGLTVEQFTKKAVIDFQNTNVFTNVNLLSGYRTSDCKYDYRIFSDKHSYRYTELINNDACGNTESLKKMMEGVLRKDLDILIRDASYFGLPTYHVIVPTISETDRRTDEEINQYHELFFARTLVLDVTKVNDSNRVRLANALAYAGRRSGSSALADMVGTEYPYPASEYRLDMIYLYSMCHFLSGKYDTAQSGMKIICDNKPKNEGTIYDAIYQYMSGMKEMKQHDEVMKYLRIFYDKQICDRLEDLFADPTQLLAKQYPVMDVQSDLYRQYSVKTNILDHIYSRYIHQQMNCDYSLDQLVKVIDGLNL